MSISFIKKYKNFYKFLFYENLTDFIDVFRSFQKKHVIIKKV